MKIALMSAWNSDSGASVWAELVGRSFVKMGHQLTVFSFLRKNFHGWVMARKDENYVKRCFTTSLYPSPFLDPKPILTSDFDIFIVNDIAMLPYRQLYKIFPAIKKKAKTINVIHENRRFNDPLIYQFNFDAVTCFDERFYQLLIKDYPPSKISMIPYPCAPNQQGDKLTYRRKLKLAEEVKIILTFGRSSQYTPELLPTISQIKDKYPLLVLLISKNRNIISQFQDYSSYLPIQIRRLNFLPLQELYPYLFAADVWVYNKKSGRGVVVSSAVFQTLGSGCPILARRSNFVETFNGEIIKYRTKNEFKKALLDVFEEGKRCREAKKKAWDFVEAHSAEKITQTYLRLFQVLLSKGRSER